MEGLQLRMRMVTIEPGGVFGPVPTTRADRGLSLSCRERSPTIEMGSPQTWAGRRLARSEHVHGSRQGTVPAVEISVDVVRHEQANVGAR